MLYKFDVLKLFSGFDVEAINVYIGTKTCKELYEQNRNKYNSQTHLQLTLPEGVGTL